MKRLQVNFLFPLLLLVISVIALSQQMFRAPPLGKLLDPFTGIVWNERDRGFDRPDLVIDAGGLSRPVTVIFDDRRVPHLFAANTEDLYFAQGYVTAFFRLWEMDFLSYAAAGRLSEIFGDGMLNYDRNQRRIGVPEAARRSLEMIEKDTQTRKALTAYAKGVNAYIRTLTYRDLPLEYKLLDYSPEPWTGLKSCLIMKQMANTLSGYEEDFSMTNLVLALGEEKFNMLFPEFQAGVTPVAGNMPGEKGHAFGQDTKPGYLNYSFMSTSPVSSASPYNPRLGSNSWAVSGRKTSSGHPILCSDPHLNLSLPSVWMEMQLSSPDQHAYGVSIPGTPAIIIGFNDNVAWGLTNGQDDVKDWYKLKISDDYKKYELDGKWLDLQHTVEEIKIRGQQTLLDTIYHTIHGPIVSNKAFPGQDPELLDHALKWELQNPSNEFLCFIELNRARRYEDYKAAIRHYASPIQNFTFACKDNTIAVDHQGRMAVKWPGQGRFVLSGTLSSHLYTKYIPDDSLPHLLNPACNYVLSANQHPTDSNYPYYYNGYFSENRANRIRQLLERENKFDLEKMKAMQMDNTSIFAIEALPVLTGTLAGNVSAGSPLSAEEKKDLVLLTGWKGDYDYGDEASAIFELWWRNIKENTWDEFKRYPYSTTLPSEHTLLELIRTDPGNVYFDKDGTTLKENAGMIVRQAFDSAVAYYERIRKQGSVKWGDLHRVDIKHLTNIGLLSRMGLPSAGYPEAINAMGQNWGPSWRMIVELGDRPRALGIYPGGQSGNYGSAYYDNFVDDWNKGKYYPLTFYESLQEAQQGSHAGWILKGR